MLGAISYNISTDIIAVLDTSADTITKVIALELCLATTQLLVFISLDELKSLMLNNLRRGKIKKLPELVQLLKRIIKKIARRCKLTLSMGKCEFLTEVQSEIKLQLFKDTDCLTSSIYLAADSAQKLKNQLNTLHRQYMMQFSKIFNTPLTFPILIGEAIISQEQLTELAIGNIIIFDKLNLPQLQFSCKLNNLWANLKLDSPAVNREEK